MDHILRPFFRFNSEANMLEAIAKYLSDSCDNSVSVGSCAVLFRNTDCGTGPWPALPSQLVFVRAHQPILSRAALCFAVSQ